MKQIRSYFASLHDPVKDDELIIIGDRLFTDIVMANRLREKSWTERIGVRPATTAPAHEPLNPQSASQSEILPLLTTRTTLGIWTTGVWVKEATFMRLCERKLLEGVRMWVVAPAKAREKAKFLTQVGDVATIEQSRQDVQAVKRVKETEKEEAAEEEDMLTRAFVRRVPSPPPKKKTILQNIFAFVRSVQFRRST